MWHQERGLLPKAIFMKGLDAKGVSPEAPYQLRWFQWLKGELGEMIGPGYIAFQVTITVLATTAGEKLTRSGHDTLGVSLVRSSSLWCWRWSTRQGNFGDWSCRLEVHAIRCFLYKPTHSGLFFPERRFVAGFFRRLLAYLTPHISHTYPAHHTYPTHIYSKRIPHISHTYSSTPHISHTYPFQTYPTHIPHISSTPHISHTCPFQTYPTHIPHISSTPHISHTYPFQTYPTHIPHISSILHISIPNVSHTYPTHIQHTTHIHSKRIPPIPIQGLHEYEYHCMSFHILLLGGNGNENRNLAFPSNEYHCMSFHTLLLGGNGNENRNLAFPPIVWRAYEHGIHR